MRRRDFMTLLAGAAAWPLAARAQQGDRVRHIGYIGGDENDPLAKRSYSAFTQALAELGWTGGRNVRIDLRWGGIDDTNRMRALAQELVSFEGMTQTLILREFLATSAPVPNVFPNV